MNLDTVTLIASVPAIVALVNLGKRLGITGELSMALAVVLGVVLNVADYLWAGHGWYAAATQGLILGLGAAGLYDLTDRDAPEVIVNTPEPVTLDAVGEGTVVHWGTHEDNLVHGAPWPDNWPPEPGQVQGEPFDPENRPTFGD